MPGLKLYTSNRLEALAEELSEILRQPLASATVPEIILVQSRGMERWLSLEMARRLGICANIRFPFPNHFVEELFSAVLPDRPGSPAFDPEVLVWRVMRLLPRCLGGEEFRPLKAYLDDDDRGVKRYQLSRIIARLFDQYLVYRPDMVLGWESGRETGHWQAVLWRALAAEGPGPASGGPMERGPRTPAGAGARRGAADARADLRLRHLGPAALPPAPARCHRPHRSTCNLFVMNPCREYWYLIYSDREMRRLVRPASGTGPLRRNAPPGEGQQPAGVDGSPGP